MNTKALDRLAAARKRVDDVLAADPDCARRVQSLTNSGTFAGFRHSVDQMPAEDRVPLLLLLSRLVDLITTDATAASVAIHLLTMDYNEAEYGLRREPRLNTQDSDPITAKPSGG